MRATGAAIALGLAIDRFVGEPPVAVHPVARFGQAMTALETQWYRNSKTAGVVFCAIGVGGATLIGVGLQRLLGRPAATAAAVSIAVAGRMLGREAAAIGDLLAAGDLASARARLPSLVGRTATHLSETEVARAVIESVAENSVDAVIAPIMWAVIGGAPLVLAHRAVNTLDAMVGHHSPRYERFGWASARLDDVANWLPARLAAITVAGVRPGRANAIQRVVRRDAAQHPSPNGGVIESAFAAALGIRLGGANRYGDVIEDRGVLGDGRRAAAGDVAAAITLMNQATAALAAAAIAGPLLWQRARFVPRCLPGLRGQRVQRGGSALC
ncbi:MAG: adenosylcobinamide-phosphate synthase CbiB [Ilumatobacteraceae bacterium]